MEILENEADVTATVIVKIVFCKLGKSFVLEVNFSTFKLVKPTQKIE